MAEFSKTEQDYLKAIYQLHEKTGGLVGVTDIAAYLKVAAPSATEMIKRLAKKDLVAQKKYYGVSLKPEGYHEARFILKSHRVWETFLVDQADYQIDEVHEEAERLEHSSSKRLVERLYALMNFPKTDPHGSEIPAERFWEGKVVTLDLSQAEIAHRYQVVALTSEIKDFLAYLTIEQPKFITVITILADDSVIVKTEDDVKFVIPQFQRTAWQLTYYAH
ncbi:MAG: metal-dependent transcriptional regulator [Streptococcaceae bacterium]|jgi:DtxR family Mn-dependent transcriptional regulator|nr:metal-dependent transcriptional regulator [Streptococcaceae bacterium]